MPIHNEGLEQELQWVTKPFEIKHIRGLFEDTSPLMHDIAYNLIIGAHLEVDGLVQKALAEGYSANDVLDAGPGMAAFHFDSKNDPQAAMDAVDGGITLVGNINNPETLYARGPAEVRRCLDAGVQLVAPECAIPLATKLENLLEIPRAVKEWHDERQE